ncbi:hypothetical protein FACS189437_03620 [Bacteroidia bacterium]|nr:hypothetical protein FACS189437_03620 [Bacteroidia bacterium]
MKNTAWLNYSISILFGIIVWLFFAVFYRHHLHYQEEMQLFLTSGAYFLETIALPGGLSNYLSRFFTQFFVDSFAGGFCISLLLVVLQQLIWQISVAQSQLRAKKSDYYLLSFLPSTAYACALMDENVLLTALIALILVLLAVVFFQRIKSIKIRLVYLLLMIPLLYWIAGGAYGDFYRYPKIFPVILLIIFLLVLFIPILCRYLPENSKGKSRIISGCVQLAVLILLAAWGLKTQANWEKEEIMAYDYFARSEKWNSIIHLADNKAPTSPLSVATLNLALAKQNYLPDYQFDYFQNGPEGLLPTFQKEFMVDMMAGEIYYHLGLVNTAQRFAFEGMEAIPGYQKSVRSIQRLAETNLINGQYEVAKKYLTLLKQTLFYKKWAEETVTYLYNEEKINAHPEWGKLRQFRPEKDFLFSEQEKDQVLGILYQNNTNNRMAYEYLLAYTLLAKDLPHFFDYYFMEKKKAGESVPKSYQEALAFIWGQTNFNPEMRPAGLTENAVIGFQSFSNDYQMKKSEKALAAKYGKTYWYYLLFKYN